MLNTTLPNIKDSDAIKVIDTIAFMHSLNSVFDDTNFLKAYDEVLLKSEHYKTILSIHYKSLKNCSNIIDLGCGTGNLVLKLLAEGKFITGMDISKSSLDFLTKKTNNNKNVHI